MHLYISKSKMAPFKGVYKNSPEFELFPGLDRVEYNKDHLLPIGLLTKGEIHLNTEHDILIALPICDSIFEGDVSSISYSHTSQGWQLASEDRVLLSKSLGEYEIFYNRSKEVYQQSGQLFNSLEVNNVLLKLGGQPELGCNWDAYLWNEESNEYEQYFDAIDQKQGKVLIISQQEKLVYMIVIKI